MRNNQTENQVVYIVDDEPTIRHLIAQTLAAVGYRTVCFASGGEFLAAVDQSSLGCAVVDFCLPDLSGLEVQERLATANSPLAFILVSGRAKVKLAVAAMRRGAIDVLEKPFEPRELISAVESALTRAQHLSQQLAEEQGISGLIAALTKREKQVFERMLAGESSKQIAKQLGISRKTVEVHRSRIRAKLRFESMNELAQMTIAYGRAIDRQRQLTGLAENESAE